MAYNLPPFMVGVAQKFVNALIKTLFIDVLDFSRLLSLTGIGFQSPPASKISPRFRLLSVVAVHLLALLFHRPGLDNRLPESGQGNGEKNAPKTP